MAKKILFIYNQVSESQKTGLFAECILAREIERIRLALEESNTHVLSLDLHSPAQLEKHLLANQTIDLSFVIAEGFKARPQTLYNGHGAALVRKYLRKYNIPSTHSSVESMEICRNKDLTYTKLLEKGLPIPKYLEFDTQFLKNIGSLKKQVSQIGYPVFVKPAGGGNSIGISPDSVVYTFQQLKEQVMRLHQELGPTGLVIEQFLEGQEYTIGIIGNRTKYILPIVGFPRNMGIRDCAIKKIEYLLRDQFEIIDERDSRFNTLLELGITTFEAVQANDVLRIDLKEDGRGNIFVIDVNGTPALSSTGSLNFMASKLGLEHKQLIQLVLYESMLRYELTPSSLFEEFVKATKSKLVKFESIGAA